MGRIFGDKPKPKRRRKTTEEKLRALAEKRLLELAKTDDNILRLLIQKWYGIDVPPESERQMNELVERTRLNVFRAVSGDLTQDPEVREALRDKYIDELFGIKTPAPRPRGRGGYPQSRDPRRQIENWIQSIKKLDQLKAALGADTSVWTKILQDPEIIKLGMGLIQGLLGSFGITPQSTGRDGNYILFAQEINGKWVETKMTYQEYLQLKTQKNSLEKPMESQIADTQRDSNNNPATANSNPSSQPPSKPDEIKLPGTNLAQDNPAGEPAGASDNHAAHLSSDKSLPLAPEVPDKRASEALAHSDPNEDKKSSFSWSNLAEAIKALKANQDKPHQGEPASDSDNSSSEVPYTISATPISEKEEQGSAEICSQPAPAQDHTDDTFWVNLAKIKAAVDKAPKEFAERTLDASRAGDQEAEQIKKFLLNHSYEDISKAISQNHDCTRLFEENREWFEQVITALREQA
jgi:hypothetical protein